MTLHKKLSLVLVALSFFSIASADKGSDPVEPVKIVGTMPVATKSMKRPSAFTPSSSAKAPFSIAYLDAQALNAKERAALERALRSEQGLKKALDDKKIALEEVQKKIVNLTPSLCDRFCAGFNEGCQILAIASLAGLTWLCVERFNEANIVLGSANLDCRRKTLTDEFTQKLCGQIHTAYQILRNGSYTPVN